MAEEKKGFFRRLAEGLSKTRDNIVSGMDAIFNGFSDIDDDFYDEIEEILVMGDIGINATTSIIENLKRKVKEQHIKKPEECKELLINSIKEQMRVGETAYEFEHRTSVVLVIGVNGVGKTTSVGKLAGKLKDQGRRVIVGAADTFRAAAAEQLSTWGSRVGVETVRGEEGADPASVAYTAVQRGIDEDVDVVLVDTAGRLQNKKGLMDELGKVKRVAARPLGEDRAIDEVLLVLDATTGQNGLQQAKVFSEAVDITGIVLTKLDGTAKGGIVVAVQRALGVPVKLIGLGEGADDLAPFDAAGFVDAIVDA